MSKTSVSVITDEKKGIMFRMLAEKPLYETGVEFGLDKQYSTAVAVKNRMYRLYQEVQKNPDRYGLSQDLCNTVVKIVSGRTAEGKGFNAHVPTLQEAQQAQIADDNDVTKLVLSGRAKAFKLLHKKLDVVGKTKKSLESVSLPQLATVAAILFDKGQIAQGQATENISVLAKIDANMSPADALAAVLRMREVNIIAKDTK